MVKNTFGLLGAKNSTVDRNRKIKLEHKNKFYKPERIGQVNEIMQSWALSVFLNFVNNKKGIFAFFIKLLGLGVGFLNRTGAEIGY